MVNNFDDIIALAQEKGTVKVVIAAAQDEIVLQGVDMAKKLNLIDPLFVGDKDKIRAIIDEHGLDLRNEGILDVKDKTQACYTSIDMVLAGEAEAIMKGKMDSAGFLRTVLDKERGVRTGRLVSNVCLLEDPKAERILYLTDAVVNIRPDLLEKVEIIENAVEFVKVMGIPIPRVAVISAVELITPNMPSTIDAACLSKMSERGQIKDAIVDGPFAIDNIFSVEAAQKKGINSPLVGNVDILLAPDIETANVIFKLLVHFAKYKGIGIFVGTKILTIQLPREAPPEAKLVGIATSILMLKEMYKDI